MYVSTEIIFEEPSQFMEQNCFDLNENPLQSSSAGEPKINSDNNNLLDSLRNEDK